MVKKPKDKAISYTIKVNDSFVKEFNNLKEAREFIRNYPVSYSVKKVEIVKNEIISTILSCFTPKAVLILANDMTPDFEELPNFNGEN